MPKITCDEMRRLCVENNWFTFGTNEQYDKLFFALESGFSLDDIATILWLCSDRDLWTRDVIKHHLKLFLLQKKRKARQ